jgi:hypothetical protein
MFRKPMPATGGISLVGQEMKSLLQAVVVHLALAGALIAGRPIVLDEIEACSGAELVVIATIPASKEVPADAPFGGSEWHSFGFTKFAKAEVKEVLLGTAPRELRIYGGKISTGTDFRLEEGDFFVLLTKVEEGAYRAVDWHYSFAPLKDGKVGWLVERYPAKREWIEPSEVLRRIKANKLKGEQDAVVKDPSFHLPFEGVKAKGVAGIEIEVSGVEKSIEITDRKWITEFIGLVTPRDYPITKEPMGFSMPGEVAQLTLRDEGGEELATTTLYGAWNLMVTGKGGSGELGSNRLLAAFILRVIKKSHPNRLKEWQAKYRGQFSGEYEKEYRDAIWSERGDAVQPATAAQSKPEGKEKPKPEPEERTQ